MNKRKVKHLIYMGIVCLLLLVLSSIYAVLYNHGRLVEPMDFSTYTFHIKDTPMVLSGILPIMYIIYMTIFIIKYNMRKPVDTTHTKKLSPYLGFLGFFGFFGFAGFWTYNSAGIIYPFIFFIFFGFFGFYYDGKLSNTLRDELFEQNVKTASIKAYKTGFALLFIVIWGIGMGMLSKNLEWCAIFMLISISLIYALVLFLDKYYLYRLEKED